MNTKGRLVPIALLLLVLAPGCGEERSAPASLKGTVKYRGEPVTAGTVTLHTENAGVYHLPIRPDGTYSGTDLPAGELVVTISTPPPAHSPEEYAEGMPQVNAEQAKKMRSPRGGRDGTTPSVSQVHTVQIPYRYGDKNKSGLTVTLSKGKNTQDFDLE